MKAQHQIKFKRRRKSGKLKERASKAQRSKISNALESTDVASKAVIVVGEREMKLARALSDTEKEVRDSSLSSLRDWLAQHSDRVGEKELDRLWKGLFYCIWMADKRPIITETIRNVVDLADIAGWPFLEALYTCLMREWFGIDRHRVDKFYELANVAVEKCTALVVSSEDITEATKTYMAVLQGRVWEPAKVRGLGLSLHIFDVFMEKIMSPIMIHAKSLPSEEKKQLVELLIKIPASMIGSANGNLLAVGKRIQDCILDKLLDFIKSEEVSIDGPSQVQIAKEVSETVFKVAANKNTSNEIRKALYSIHVDLKDFSSSSVER